MKMMRRDIQIHSNTSNNNPMAAIVAGPNPNDNNNDTTQRQRRRLGQPGHSRRRRRQQPHQHYGHSKFKMTSSSWPALLIGIAACCWLVLIISTQSALDNYLRHVEGTSMKFWHQLRHGHPPSSLRGGGGDNRRRRSSSSSSKSLETMTTVTNTSSFVINNTSQSYPQSDSPKRYIMYMAIESGQGLGNLMNGLLAAQLLGYEFDRIVCVSTQFEMFHMAFESCHPLAIQDCPTLPQVPTKNVPQQHSITLINFYNPPDECELQTLLSSIEAKVVYITGNTYPRWPPIPKSKFFLQYYRPKSILLDMLPWRNNNDINNNNKNHNKRAAIPPPTTVVHLRQADGNLDPRKGLDPLSLQKLGQLLPRDTTFLVTNNVDWYHYFHQEFGWSHPSWNHVQHSALGVSWGQGGLNSTNRSHTDNNDPTNYDYYNNTESIEQVERRQQYQMWCDWYTILMAQRVYHTHSDFSLSAIHWMDIKDSKTIQGVDIYNGNLILTDETWRVDGETTPLVNRTKDELRQCFSNQQQNNNIFIQTQVGLIIPPPAAAAHTDYKMDDHIAKLLLQQQLERRQARQEQKIMVAGGKNTPSDHHDGLGIVVEPPITTRRNVNCQHRNMTLIQLPNGTIREQYDCPNVTDASASHVVPATPWPMVEYKNPKYIMFTDFSGQGIGNQMNGLLAAHLLGYEFGRIVCVSKQFEDFHPVFTPLHPQALRDCPTLPQIRTEHDEEIQLVNFLSPPNECQLRQTMASDRKILYLTGNTYPRWPPIPPAVWFTHNYQPTTDLQHMLPWKTPPHTVVHLRQPDGDEDPRQGLDDKSLRKLGEILSSTTTTGVEMNTTFHDQTTFLVTNRVTWYDFFQKEFGWDHPSWDIVIHSGIGIPWDRRPGSKEEIDDGTNETVAQLRKRQQNLQVWSDWYTILSAKRVYHTHSDFSLSAIHWMDIKDSKTIQGVDEHGNLILTDESWRVDGETPPLVSRTKDQLRLCTPEDNRLQIQHVVAAKFRQRQERLDRALGSEQVSTLESNHNERHEQMIRGNTNTVQRRDQIPQQNMTSNSKIKPPKYIMFIPISQQGIGNLMNGVLAAHLLGQEFGRVVCVSTTFASFHSVFESVDPQTIKDCPTLPQKAGDREQIPLLNYMKPPDECNLRDKLISSTKVLYLVSNTYPRWPPIPSQSFFTQYYRPKSEFTKRLPWKNPPHTVVHLRQPDGTVDARKGLDENSLRKLGEMLPRNTTFLVTNRVDWYDYFSKEFGWLHPSWEEVKHSALGLSWGKRSVLQASNESHGRENKTNTAQQDMQMWCDWYTILMAQRVYHTHSDFSLSAIHWMDIKDSKTIQGIDELGNLMLSDESWRVDGETPPLVDRPADQLRQCQNQNLIAPRLAGRQQQNKLDFSSFHSQSSKGREQKQHNKQEQKFVGGMVQQLQVRQENISLSGASNKNPRYIMYLPIGGQGVGNLMNGVLAVHLLGLEFDRVVCVSTEFQMFHSVFEPVHPLAIIDCPNFPQNFGNETPIALITFAGVPNECDLQDKLASSTKVIYILSNTYPRWPPIPSHTFFTQYYRPKSNFVELLPWKSPPHTVVHLRQPDGLADARKGLDKTSLRKLGEMLPRNTTFLVTNRVQWYDYFAKEFGWLHPSWDKVKHSANGLWWGDRYNASATFIEKPSSTGSQQQDMQMWCDWYTILMAQRVYHTHSDFSLSAIHWMDIKDSKTIQGVDNHGNLLLTDESWRVDGETPPLVNRTKAQLRNCKSHMLANLGARANE